ncbi:MAG: LacI family DNA-binding transcriptional regulator [Phycisphaeraceae bacterium]
MAVTLKEIAEKAGVSLTTVSIALGSEGRISEATRKRIRALAEELGYRPNLLVQGIQTGKTRTVGVLMQIESVFDSLIFRGIHEVLADSDYVPLVLTPSPKVDELRQIHALIDRRVDGILLNPSGEAMWEGHLGEAIERKVPVVALDTEVQSFTPHIDFVGTDDEAGGRRAAEILYEHGHRRAAVITLASYPQPPFFRRRSFEQRFSELGANCIAITLPWEAREEISDLIRDMFEAKHRPTAVFATTDPIAEQVYEVAKSLGLKIPEDVSVIGFADEPISRFLTPKLSTFRQDPIGIGRRGAELLLLRIEGKGGEERVRDLLEPEFVERESVGPNQTLNQDE